MTAPAVSAIIAVLVAVLVGGLRAMGRRWGEGRLWTSSATSSSTSQRLLDPYSFTHVLHGVLLYWALSWTGLGAGARLVWALALEVAWELAENTPAVIARYRAETASVGYEGDSVLNAVGDVACCAAGYWLAASVPWQASAAVFVASEAALAWWIRDNLVLNVLQLVAPSPAVKAWQQAAAPAAPPAPYEP